LHLAEGTRRARTPAELGFDQHDRQRLTRALRRARDVRLYRRVQAVLLVARGLPVPEVARITGAKADAVYDWGRRSRGTRRPEDLGDAPRPGRPRAAAGITDARIAREFRRDPLRLGYDATGWTVALLAGHLGRTFGCPITARTLRRRMRGLGLRWKRPRYVYADRDPHRAQKKGDSSAA
jgi:transposase